MTTIVNTPPSGESNDSGLGLILGVIIVIALAVFFFVYALPTLRQNSNQPSSTNVITIPVPGATGATGAKGTTN